MVASIALPRLMRIGAGASRLLPEVLGQLGLSRPFVVTDPYLAGSGRTDTLLERLTSAGAQATIFSETVPDPTVASVEAALAALQAGDFDCVVGFGGGSPMDTAKAVAVLARHGGQMRDYKAPRQQDEPGLPIVAIPTTAGTGSEATRFTIVTDEATDEKMLCIGLAYLPVAALVDYELTLTKPKRLTADTGIDALTHAIEAYVSRKAQPVLGRDGAPGDAADRPEPAPGLDRSGQPGGARGDDARRDPGRHRLLERARSRWSTA